MSAKVRYKVRILYKSGNSIDIDCVGFSINRTKVGTEYEWDDAKPRPLQLGAEHIEAVFVL